MPDPRLVSRAQRAATMLERAWDRWRSAHGLAAEPLPPVSSYVGYSVEEPWGRPRVVFGVDAADAEKLAALLLERAASSSVAGQPAPEGENLRAGRPQPGRAPQALDKVRARIPVQGRIAELNGGSEQRSEPDSEQRAESASQPGGTGASEQRGDRVREQRGEPASQQDGDGASEQREEPGEVTGPINGFDPVQANASGLSKSGVSKPGLSKSGVSKSGVSKSGVSKPGVSKPGVSKPGVSKRGAPEPGRPEPGVPEPGRSGVGVGVSSAPGASDEGAAMAAGPDGLAAPDDSVHDEQALSADAGSQRPGDPAVPRSRADGDAGDRRDASRGVADTMAAELAGWAAGELPGQASARLAAWATVGGSTSRGGVDADLRTGGGAAEQVS
jgi:hypothetical protein